MQRSFFLTDLMKTGSHELYERFLNAHSLPNQSIECTGEYYTLHTYDLDKYDRKFALIKDIQLNKAEKHIIEVIN